MTLDERIEAAAAALARHDGYLWDGDTHRGGVIADLAAYRMRIRVVLDAAGLRGAADPGPDPDLVDRDGDRWHAVGDDLYVMAQPRTPLLEEASLAAPQLRRYVEHHSGPAVEVRALPEVAEYRARRRRWSS